MILHNSFYLFKNSGKLKLQPKKAAEALNITYRLPTMNGRRLIGHCLSVLKRLLHNRPALLTAFPGFLSSEHNEKRNHATVTGIVNKLKPYQF